PVEATPPTAGYRVRKFVRRNRGLVIASVVVFSALAIGSTAATVGLFQAIKANREAEQNRKHAEASNDTAEEVTGPLIEGVARAAPKYGDATVRQVLDELAGRIDGGPWEPALEARLRSTIGKTYFHLEKLDVAQQQLEAALRAARRSLEAAAVFEVLSGLV